MADTHDVEIDALKSQLQALIVKTSQNDAARKKLHGVTMAAAGQTESPLDACWRMIMSPHAPAAMMTLMKMGVIEQLASTSTPMTARDLADKTRADPLLIVRLLRPLTPLGYVKEVDAELYEATPITKLLNEPALKGGFNFMFTCATHALSQMPSFLEHSGYKNVEGNPGTFQYTKKTDLDLFYWLMQHPELMSDFNIFMKEQQAHRGDWFDRMPVNEMFLDGASTDPNAILLVDIGGGEGHDIQAFHQAFPKAPGKLVLQDQVPVIQNIQRLDDAIVREAYDFFTPQPRKGARVYYLRSILHDWSNDKCLEILSRIKEAMKPGYSKLLLNEFILPPKNAPLYPALLDVNMMAILNGMERTAQQFMDLLDEAGFQIIRFHQDPSGESEGIVEAEPKST